jgi:cell shape-determining protein MreD
MRPGRLAAAVAAIVTALLLQATLITPLAPGLPVSLPLVLVIAVGLADGPGAGLVFGFVCGLSADLGSAHPAGVLALTWLLAGLLAGRVGARHRLRFLVLTTGVLGLLVTAATAALLVALPSAGHSQWSTVLAAAPAAVVDAALALLLVPLVRGFLRSTVLRTLHPAYVELELDSHA